MYTCTNVIYYANDATPVSEGVGEEWREERDTSNSCATVTEGQQEQRLVGLKINHTHLISKKLEI